VHVGKKNDVYKISKWRPTLRRTAIAEVTGRQLKDATADPTHHKKTIIPFA
jgi:hypothetical protein